MCPAGESQGTVRSLWAARGGGNRAGWRGWTSSRQLPTCPSLPRDSHTNWVVGLFPWVRPERAGGKGGRACPGWAPPVCPPVRVSGRRGREALAGLDQHHPRPPHVRRAFRRLLCTCPVKRTAGRRLLAPAPPALSPSQRPGLFGDPGPPAAPTPTQTEVHALSVHVRGAASVLWKSARAPGGVRGRHPGIVGLSGQRAGPQPLLVGAGNGPRKPRDARSLTPWTRGAKCLFRMFREVVGEGWSSSRRALGLGWICSEPPPHLCILPFM